MSIRSSISTRGRHNADSVGSLNPLFTCQHKSICAGFHSNITEFRNIKIWIVYPLPNTKEIHGITRWQPVRDYQSGRFGILISRHIRQWNIVFNLLRYNYDIVSIDLYCTFLCLFLIFLKTGCKFTNNFWYTQIWQEHFHYIGYTMIFAIEICTEKSEKSENSHNSHNSHVDFLSHLG